MNIFSQKYTKTYNLLNIGQRGVGKTVFMAGSYAELHEEQTRSQNLWFDCQDKQVQENIESILNYISQNNQYPPPTLKATKFSFSLKRQGLGGNQTLCNFRWHDIPGEICDIHNLEFRQMVYNSHGCCVFIDAYALRHSDVYLKVLEDIIEQVTVIASLVYLNGLEYPFAVILTKSDLIEPDPLSRQKLENRLQPLIKHLEAVKANYRNFYSSIPIIKTKSGSTLKAKGAAVALLWLVWELNKTHNPSLKNNLLKIVNQLLPNASQPQQKFSFGTLETLFNSNNGKPPTVKQKAGINLLPNNRTSTVLVALVIAGLIGISGKLLMDYQRFFQAGTSEVSVLNKINELQQSGQFNQAVSLLEKVVQQQPERIELRLQLAQLYELTGEVDKAETVYDRILVKQKNNVKALVSKAILRHFQGDTKNATALFEQAEQVAPLELKLQVRALAKNTLESPAKPMLNNK